MGVPIVAAIRKWVCGFCSQVAYTHEARPHTRFHNCAGRDGLTLPFVEEGVKARVIPNMREDYLGGDEKNVRTDERGRPFMSATTEYADGRKDVAVFAPVARVARGD